MTYGDKVQNEYFEWMMDLVCHDRYASDISYRKLFSYLHATEFTYLLPRDANRAAGGLSLRYRFAYYNDEMSDAESYIYGPCSVLEMMIALAICCEEETMSDPDIGDRTGQWFWGMINNLGLGAQTDNRFDRQYVKDVVRRFLNREYEPNGKGGLFTVRHRNADLRNVEIWCQLNWYLDELV